VLQVCDNGSGLGSKRSFKEGIGLSNTRARLEQLYPGQHALTWSDAVEGGLVVKMVVPWKLVGGALSITERKNPQ
jgi:LytS/YehU family sensor histidine kinase